MDKAGQAIKYLVFWSGLGIVLSMLVKPSEAELQKIKNFSAKADPFTEVLRAAADPKSKPIYLKKPGEQFVVPRKSEDEQPSK